MNMKNVAANINKYISMRGMTKKELAEKCKDINIRTIYKTLNGKYNTSFVTLNYIAEALEVPLSCFFEEDISQYNYILSDEEKKLIDLKRQLNSKMRERLLGYAEGLHQGNQ
ncbi:MAG: helix-turn-helix domain-containing protein [Lachnospiraceae bacterium]|nr:helix-turn-helix domain-containing protein [Lachnospiraceae bacterium]